MKRKIRMEGVGGGKQKSVGLLHCTMMRIERAKHSATGACPTMRMRGQCRKLVFEYS